MRQVSAWNVLSTCCLCLATLVGVACNQQVSSPSGVSNTPDGPSAIASEYLLASEPQGAQGVIAAREDATEGPLTVVGRIGGSANPWVEGRAAFSIVDPLLQACSDREGDDCPVPWDYCCETDRLPTATALVKIVDGSGKLVAQDSRSLLGLKELQTVVVQGTPQRDEAGNLTILATGIFVRP
jgi:hypothetical protein